MRATLITAAFGWWSLPGFILAPLAILKNASGGERPRGADGMLLWNSALVFYAKGNGKIAKGLAKQLVARNDAHAPLAKNMVFCLNHLQPNEPGRMRDAWEAQRKDRWKHVALALLVPTLVTFGVLQNQGQVSEAGVKLAQNGRIIGSKVVNYVASSAASPAQAATPEASVAP